MTIESIENSPKKLKNRWLIYTLICYFILPIFMSVLFTMREDLFRAPRSLLLLFLFSAVSFFSLYYCSYRKAGTRFLALSMILTAFYLVFTSIIMLIIVLDLQNMPLFKERISQGLSDRMSSFKIVAFFHFISLALWVRWMTLSLKLRASNRRIQEKVDPDERCKKDWLISTLLCCVGYPIYKIAASPFSIFGELYVVFTSLYETLTGYEILLIVPYPAIHSASYPFLYTLFAIPFVYICAYKKPGIRLLSIVLTGQFVLAITGFERSASYLFSYIDTLPFVVSGGIIVNLSVYTVGQIWWIVNSYRLLKMNMRIRSENDLNATLKKTPLLLTAFIFFVLRGLSLATAQEIG